MTQNSLSQRVGGAMYWNSILLPVRTLLPFAANIILVRALTQEHFAALVSITAVLNTIGQYADLGIERSLTKFFPEIETRYGRSGLVQFMVVVLAVKFAVLAVLLLAFNLFSGFFSDFFQFGEQGVLFIRAMSFLLVLGALSDVFLQLLYAYFKQKATNGLMIAFGLLQPLLIILFVALGWDILGVLVALVISTAAQVVLSLPVVRWTIREVSRLPKRAGGSWRELYIRFGKFCALNYFFNLTVYFYDLPFVVVVLTNLKDTLGVALFGLAYQRLVNPILQFAFAPLSGIQQPLFARLYVESDQDKLQAAYSSLTRFLILVLVPVGVGLTLVARNLIRLFFQSRYEAAAGLVGLLVLFLFAESILGPAYNIMLAHERYRAIIFTRILALVSIPLLLVVAPVYGVVGATIAAGIGRVLSRGVASLYIWRMFNLAFPWSFLGRVGLAAGVMGLLLYWPLNWDRPSTPIETVVVTALAIGIGMIVFVLVFKLAGGLEQGDRNRLSTLRVPFAARVVRWL